MAFDGAVRLTQLLLRPPLVQQVSVRRVAVAQVEQRLCVLHDQIDGHCNEHKENTVVKNAMLRKSRHKHRDWFALILLYVVKGLHQGCIHVSHSSSLGHSTNDSSLMSRKTVGFFFVFVFFFEKKTKVSSVYFGCCDGGFLLQLVHSPRRQLYSRERREREARGCGRAVGSGLK